MRRYLKLPAYKRDSDQSDQRIQVSTQLRGKICAGTILPSFEHNWLK